MEHDIPQLVEHHEPDVPTEAVVAHEAEGHHTAGPMDVSGEMFLWTLGTFLVIAYILAKVAWKPILKGLDAREETIRKSIEGAEEVENQLASIEEKRATIVAEADSKANDIVGRARQAGLEAERVIKEKAKKEADILRENAAREILAASDKAAASLRKDSVESAISLAGKILGEELDEEKQRKLSDQLIANL